MYADPSLQKVASAAFFDELAALLIESRSKLAAEILTPLTRRFSTPWDPST